MLRKFYPFYQNGQLKLMIGYGVDISEVKQIQKSYMQSEHRYRTLFENNPLMVFILDKAGTILSTNASVSSELGFIEKQLLNRPMINFFPEVNRADINGKLSTCFENPDKEFEWETRISKKSGKLIDTEIRAKVIYSVSGAPQLLLVCNNITNRKQNERLLEESERLNRRLIQELPVPVSIIQDDKSILVNDAFEELVGKNNEQKEVRFNELVTEEDREKLFESRERLIRGSEWVDYTVRIHPPNGPLKHVAVRDSFFNYKNHLVTLSVMNDITDRVLVEKKNKEIEERTRQIIDSALDAIVLTDLLGNIVDWNRQAQSIFGWVGREVAGKKLEDIILPDSITQISEPEKPQQKLTLNKLIETTGIGAGERTFPIELFISQIITLEGKLLAFYIRDISVRKDTEKKIQESERIEAILNNYSSSVHQI
ncbi:MAG: PAS domain-containing protein, partial [Bacteroidota bacterium]